MVRFSVQHSYCTSLYFNVPVSPLQDAFVLCCLFREANFSQEESSVIPMVDSVESVCLGSSEERTWDKLAGNESEGINQWLTNKLDNMTPNNLMFTRIYKTF